MSARRDVTLAVIAWLIVVAIGASLVWVVVSRAGEGVTDGGDDPLPAAEQSTGPTQPTRSTPTAPSPSEPVSSPTASPTDVPTSSPTAVPTSSPSDTTSLPTTPADPVRGTWQGAAGVVSVECRGAIVRLTGASPNSGYAVEVDDTGPDRIRVEFENDARDLRTRVEARCLAGAPSFTEDD